MTITSVCGTSESDADLATRFAREAEPLFDVLSRGARRLTRSSADAEDLLQDTLLHAYAGSSGSSTTGGSARTAPNKAAQPKFLSKTSPSGTSPVVPHDCQRGSAPPSRRY